MANIKTIRVEGIQHQIVDDTAIHSLQDAALTGAPTAPTPNTSDNSTRIATTAFVQAVAGGGGGGAVEEKEFDLITMPAEGIAVGVPNGWNPNTYTGQLSTLDITVNSNTVESVEDQPLMYIPNPGQSGPWGDDPIDDWIFAVEESGVQWEDPIHVRANIISPDDIKHEVELTELSVLNNGTDEILEGNLVDNYSGLKIGCKISLIHDLQKDVSTLHIIPYRYNINDTWTQDLTDLNQYVKQIQLWLCPAYGIKDEDSDFIATGYQYNLSGATERDDMMVARYGLYVVDSDSATVLVAASDYEDKDLPTIKIKLSRTKLIGGSN